MSLHPLRAAVAAWTPGRGIAGDPLFAIAGSWRGIVGDNVAANSAPLSLVGTTLTIATRTSAWSQQLQFLQGRILTGVRALPGMPPVERLSFRTGKLAPARKVARAHAVASSVARPATGDRTVAPAADAGEALARLRRRMTTAAPGERRCETCGARRAGDAGPCAPCAGRREFERGLAAERLLFAAPWLDAATVYETLPALVPGDYDRARKHLLARWWLILDRARRAGRPSPSGFERSIASSYVLLHSRLAPDRITPAVVRNLLGPELERVLWPDAPTASPPETPGAEASAQPRALAVAAPAPVPWVTRAAITDLRASGTTTTLLKAPVAAATQRRSPPPRPPGEAAVDSQAPRAAAPQARSPGEAAADPQAPRAAAPQARSPMWGNRPRPSKMPGR